MPVAINHSYYTRQTGRQAVWMVLCMRVCVLLCASVWDCMSMSVAEVMCVFRMPMFLCKWFQVCVCVCLFVLLVEMSVFTMRGVTMHGSPNGANKDSGLQIKHALSWFDFLIAPSLSLLPQCVFMSVPFISLSSKPRPLGPLIVSFSYDYSKNWLFFAVLETWNSICCDSSKESSETQRSETTPVNFADDTVIMVMS